MGRARPGTASVTVSIAGVSSAAAAGGVLYFKNPTTPGIAAIPVAGAVAITSNVTAPSATSAAIARQTGFSDGTNNVGELGTQATGTANDVTLHIDSTVTLTGASSAASAGAFAGVVVAGTPAGVASLPIAGDVVGFVAPVGYEPLYRLMRNTPVPAIGALSNETVACFGTLFPDGIEPVSELGSLTGASAQCVARTVSFTFNVRVSLAGVSSKCVANNVTPA